MIDGTRVTGDPVGTDPRPAPVPEARFRLALTTRGAAESRAGPSGNPAHAHAARRMRHSRPRADQNT